MTYELATQLFMKPSAAKVLLLAAKPLATEAAVGGSAGVSAAQVAGRD